MKNEYRLNAKRVKDIIAVTARGVNTEVRCVEGTLQLRKYPTGIVVKTVDCPRKEAPDRLMACLAYGCALLNNVVPVKAKDYYVW
jgi:hypothetical protein